MALSVEFPETAVDRPARVIGVVSPAPRAAWAEVLAADPGATALQTPDYFEAVLAASGGRDASRLYTLGDGRRLVLPLVRQRALPGLKLLGDYPGGYGHGSLLATGGLRAADVQAVVADVRGLGLTTRIGGGHHTAEQWATAVGPGVVEEGRRVDVIDVSAGYDDVLANKFSRSFRQTVRRSERAGVEVERDTTGRLMPVFYELYLAWVERWIPRSGLPPAVARWSALRQEPYAKFERVAERMGDRCRVFIARHEGRAVASCITFVYGQHAIGWRSYSIKELAAPVSANPLVQARGIQDAADSGCRWFDLGQSGDAVNLKQYKSSLGGVPSPVVDLRIEPHALTRARNAKATVEDRVVRLLARGSADARSH